MQTLGQCFVFAGSLIPLASIYPIVQSKNLEKKTVSDYVPIKTFIIPLSTYTPLALVPPHTRGLELPGPVWDFPSLWG